MGRSGINEPFGLRFSKFNPMKRNRGGRKPAIGDTSSICPPRSAGLYARRLVSTVAPRVDPDDDRNVFIADHNKW